jgi:hypothetical protein
MLMPLSFLNFQDILLIIFLKQFKTKKNIKLNKN